MERLQALPPLDGCELWQLALDLPVQPEEQALLSPDEHARAARFVFERDRRRYVAARSCLRRVLGRITAKDPAALRFASNAFGKPWLSDWPLLRFNLSHSEGAGLIALDPASLHAPCGELGVDIELPRPLSDALALAGSLFEPQECRDLAALEEPARTSAFLWGWTRKEACLKALGTGFAGAARLATGLTSEGRIVQWQGGRPLAWQRARLHSFEVPALGAFAALARLLTHPSDEPIQPAAARADALPALVP